MAAPADAAGAQAGERLPSQEAFTLTGHEGAVLNVRWNARGTYCLSCGKDRTLRLWNPHKGAAIKVYAGHGYEVRDASVAPDNATFASVGGDRAVFVWDVASGAVVRKWRGHDAAVHAVVHAAGGEVVVTGGGDQCVRVWDCRSRSPDAIQSMRAFKDDVTCVLASGTDIMAASVDGTVRRFDVRAGSVACDELHTPVACLALSHDALCVLAACADSSMRLLDKDGGQLLASYRGHTHEGVRMACAFTPTDAHVVGSSEEGDVLYWDLVSGRLVSRFRAHAGVPTSLAMHPTQPCLLTCGVDAAVRVWV